MPADPRDDFDVLVDREHMMFGLDDPYGWIREVVDARLCQESPDTIVDRIVAYDDPKWLTIARRDDQHSGTVTQFGFCVRLRITVTIGYGSEGCDATLTCLVGGWEDPDHHRRGTYIDLHAEATAGFEDERFRQRFLEFRDETGG